MVENIARWTWILDLDSLFSFIFSFLFFLFGLGQEKYDKEL